MSKKMRVALGFVLAGVFFAGVMAGGPARSMVGSTESAERHDYLKAYAAALKIVKEKYVDSISDKDLIYASIKGMLGVLDPHSSFLTPEEYRAQETDLKGEFGGIGIDVSMKDGFPVAMRVTRNEPAFLAGVEPGDQIMQVDGKPTRNMSRSDVLKHIMGRKGERVTLSIMRKGFQRPQEFKIVLDVIKIKSVRSKLLDETHGYITIEEFREQTGKDLQTAINELQRLTQGRLEGILLDLRDNPGGLFDEAVAVSDRFLTDGLITYTQGRKQEQKLRFYAHKEDDYLGPLVVLVNEGSASAAEIVAGALQDRYRALIVGARTFGKGSVQSVFPRADGSVLLLTTSQYYTPAGRSIQAEGIHPDIAADSGVVKKKIDTFTLVREENLDRHLRGAHDAGGNALAFRMRNNHILIPDEVVESDFQLAVGLSVLKSLGPDGKRPFLSSSVGL